MKVDFSSYSAVFRYLAVGPLVAFGLLSILATGESEKDSGTTLPPSQLAFRADDGNGAEFWKSDGTDTGTVMVKNINETVGVGSDPSGFAVLNGVVYFSADNGVDGVELWKSDGTDAGTVMLFSAKPFSLQMTSTLI